MALYAICQSLRGAALTSVRMPSGDHLHLFFIIAHFSGIYKSFSQICMEIHVLGGRHKKSHHIFSCFFTKLIDRVFQMWYN